MRKLLRLRMTDLVVVVVVVVVVAAAAAVVDVVVVVVRCIVSRGRTPNAWR